MGTSELRSFLSILGGAIFVGALAGVGLTVTSDGVPADATAAPSMVVAAIGLRQRAPQPGDSWGGCNDARTAGTAPIYRGEPGYRENMDGDGDGIACEPAP